MNDHVKILINSFIAGLVLFMGAFLDGNITRIELVASFGMAVIAGATLYRDWLNAPGTKPIMLFKFI